MVLVFSLMLLHRMPIAQGIFFLTIKICTMKKRMFTTGVALAMVAGLFAFTTTQSGIVGKVAPADGASTVWAISGSDSAKSAVTSRSFSLAVKAGTYNVIVDDKEPYKDVTLENVEVKDGQATDLGEISLQQ